MRLSTFVISLLLVSLFAGIFVVFYAGGTAYYGASMGDSSANISSYDQWNNLSVMVADMGTEMQNIQDQPSSGGFNILGDFLSYGWNTIKTIFKSINIFTVILDTGFSSIPGGYSAVNQAKLIIGAIVVVVFIIILVGVLTGRERL